MKMRALFLSLVPIGLAACGGAGLTGPSPVIPTAAPTATATAAPTATATSAPGKGGKGATPTANPAATATNTTPGATATPTPTLGPALTSCSSAGGATTTTTSISWRFSWQASRATSVTVTMTLNNGGGSCSRTDSGTSYSAACLSTGLAPATSYHANYAFKASDGSTCSASSNAATN